MRGGDKVHNADFGGLLGGQFGEDECLAKEGGFDGGKKSRCLCFRVSVTTNDFLRELLDAGVHEESGVAAYHFTDNPVFAFFVADIGPPGGQRYTDSLRIG
jgi:hypothetical protein